MTQETTPIPVPDLVTLRDVMVDEIYKAFGMSPTGWIRQHFGFLFHEPTSRLAHLGHHFDRLCAEEGAVAAMRYVLRQFAQKISFTPPDKTTREGPLLVVSNHPGTVDAISIGTTLGRDDLKIVAGGIPFLQNLPHGKNCFIWAPLDLHQRMLTIRSCIRHLQNGGAVLIFPSGHIDPDPEVLPGADQCLQEWSSSIEIMLRKAQTTQVQVAVVSGVLSSRYIWHPLVHLRKKMKDRQRIMEFMQVIHQLLHPGELLVSPKVSYSTPVLPTEWIGMPGENAAVQILIAKARKLLAEHLLRPSQDWVTQTV